jgi:hypothetical protein
MSTNTWSSQNEFFSDLEMKIDGHLVPGPKINIRLKILFNRTKDLQYSDYNNVLSDLKVLVCEVQRIARVTSKLGENSILHFEATTTFL